MLINHISVSRKKCYDLCEQQYKFRYHLKIPVTGPEPFYFVYGTVLHTIAELYVQQKAATPIENLMNDILDKKIPLDEHGRQCPDFDAEARKKLKKHVQSVKKLTERTGTDGYTEYEFKYDLDHPNEKLAVGFIDRLIIKGDSAFIIDYKTTKKGKWRVDSESVKHDLQLRMYSRVVQRDFGLKPQNIRAALYYVEGENLIAAQYSQESLDQVEDDLKNSYITIENANPDKVWGKVGWHCKTCDYAPICPFYSAPSKDQSWNGDMSKISQGDAWNV